MRKLFPILAAVLLALPFMMGQQYNVPFNPPVVASGCPTQSAGIQFVNDDGTNHSYMIALASGTTYAPVGNDWTMVAIIRPDLDTPHDGGDNAIFSQWNTPPTRQFLWRTDGGLGAAKTGTNLEFYTNGANAIDSAPGELLTEELWFVVYAIYDVTGNVLSIGYRPVASCATLSDSATDDHGGNANTAANFLIGSSKLAGEDNFEGGIAYALYLDGVEWTQTEVEAFCNAPCTEYANWDTAAERGSPAGDANSFFYPMDGPTDLTDILNAHTATAVEVGTGTLGTPADGPYD